jgi:hypothetical protein
VVIAMLNDRAPWEARHIHGTGHGDGHCCRCS